MPSVASVGRTGRCDCSTRRMISNFSEAGYLIARLPHPRSCFFEQTQFQRLFGNNLLQSPGLTAKVRHLAAGGRTRRVARQSPLAGLQELLRPAVIEALGNTFPAAQFGNAGLPRRPSRTMRIFSSAEYCWRVARRMFFKSRSDGELAVPDFCLICAPRIATMSQKSSLPQNAKSVSLVLIPDRKWRRFAGRDCAGTTGAQS